MPTKDSTVIAVRVRNQDLKVILKRAKRRKLTINGWLTWAVKDGIRSRKKARK